MQNPLKLTKTTEFFANIHATKVTFFGVLNGGIDQ